MVDLNATGWILVASCAVMAGASKTGIPGISILVAPVKNRKRI